MIDINASSDGTTLQVFIDGRSYRLNELGSGLAHFILVLSMVAPRRAGFVLIDEPELNLHPSLQVDFLTTVGAYASVGTIFSTHSIGLARTLAERIYSVRSTPNGAEVTSLEATPRLSEFLGEMSFSGYQELGFETVLLVEGPSDVRTVQQFLRLLKKDHQVVLLPLGGAGLINADIRPQLEEIKRITTRILVLIDSEKDAAQTPISADREAFVSECVDAGVDCHVLERRAIENYLSTRAIQAVKGTAYSALEPYRGLKDRDPAWGKSENWRIAREMNWGEVSDTDLGQFLSRV